MPRPTQKSRFQVISPTRAYATLVGVCALMLTVGLVLPLALASAGTGGSGPGSSSSQPVAVKHVATAGSFAASRGDLASISTAAQGVSAHSVTVGIVTLDLSPVVPLGLGLPNFQVSLQQDAWNTLINAVNARGGINGRKIVPVFERYNPLATDGPNSPHAICESLAVDHRVFAVLGYVDSAVPCTAVDYHLPTIEPGPELANLYKQSNNLLVTLGPSWQREAVNWAAVLVQGGLLGHRKVGLVSVADHGQSQLPAEALQQELQTLGHPVDVAGYLENGNTLPFVQPLIQKMKSEGIKAVLLTTDFATALQFIALADNQNFYPQYFVSDMGALAANGLVKNAEQGFNGAIGLVSGPVPQPGVETPAQRACLQATNDYTKIPVGQISALPQICSMFYVFEHAAGAAGSDLNPRSFIRSVEGLGTVPYISTTLSGTYAPGKTDYGNELWPERWVYKKHDYVPDGAPIKLK